MSSGHTLCLFFNIVPVEIDCVKVLEIDAKKKRGVFLSSRSLQKEVICHTSFISDVQFLFLLLVMGFSVLAGHQRQFE